MDDRPACGISRRLAQTLTLVPLCTTLIAGCYDTTGSSSTQRNTSINQPDELTASSQTDSPAQTGNTNQTGFSEQNETITGQQPDNPAQSSSSSQSSESNTEVLLTGVFIDSAVANLAIPLLPNQASPMSLDDLITTPMNPSAVTEYHAIVIVIESQRRSPRHRQVI